MIVALLTARARIATALAHHGDAIASTPIERPIFITGLPRTGTTMLHHIMAGLDGLRAYTPWEMRYVVPRQAIADWREVARSETVALLQARLERMPELASIHPIVADAPDECNWLTRLSFASLAFGYMLHVPSYVRWLFGRPQLRVYSEHRVQLQLLAHHHGHPGPGARLILKDPGHLWHLAELFDTYPDALVVRLHRDPAEALPSLCSLLHVVHRTDSDRADPQQVGAAVLEMVELGLERERMFRESPRSQQILDIEFHDLMDAPLAVVRRICERAGHLFDERAHAHVAEWLRDHPRHKAGRHTYTAAAFGLDEREIRERLGERG
jgi:hypothetical protein